MEYLGGGSLADHVPAEPAQALGWLEEAASALDAAHEAGVVHRDVKPSNLLLDDRGHVKGADFGVASATGTSSFTQTGTIRGTAGYLSPEQARGERATAASDRYALAVVAWELLVGRRPFEADAPTAEAYAHVNTPVPSVHDAKGSLPIAFDAVFQRALAKDPGVRYPTAAEFVAELRRAFQEDAGDTWVVPATTRVPPAASPPSRWWIPALVALLLAGGAVAVVLAARGNDSADKPPKQQQPRTIVHTVTGPGTTVRETVTAQPQPPPTTTAAQSTTSSTGPTTPASGTALNDAGFRKMQAGDYQGALPLLEQAVQQLNGTGSTAEAYAEYNLALTRFALGSCDGVLDLLDRSQQVQGKRHEIDRLRHDAQKRCR
jgi:serine/threonine-protein kinase